MKIIKNPNQLQKICIDLLKKKKTIGLVPTMGALHNGHISLIKKSVSQNDITVVSVYVNPIQFGPNEDYNKYPRPIEQDIKICKDNKVDFLFLPTNEILYGKNFSTYVFNDSLSKIMCGVTRPNHFQGVTTVVSKLFNIVMPDRAYFGLKDYQQYVIIKQMVSDLNFKTKIIGCPIVREKTGLAMSSRNKYLSTNEALNASIISKVLIQAKKEFTAHKPIISIIKDIKNNLSKITDCTVEYIEIREAETLKEAKENTKNIVIAVAVRINKVRLIDNIVCKK
ncbi:pantoate--beta-alanine ligase [Candidatus Ruminimicrobium bovinum]|uniref:pantoate--beta-alanine ligase n=1 Tax=Candidatus Ruminimicrobium bovinum TaxID=3242779 RepID=UPI0039B97701